MMRTAVPPPLLRPAALPMLKRNQFQMRSEGGEPMMRTIVPLPPLRPATLPQVQRRCQLAVPPTEFSCLHAGTPQTASGPHLS
jgi:hypothetical protein